MTAIGQSHRLRSSDERLLSAHLARCRTTWRRSPNRAHSRRSASAPGTALYAPHLRFEIPVRIGSIGWFSAAHSLSLNIPWAVALSQVGGHAAASFRDIPADPPRVEPGPMVWRSIAIAAQKFADSEPGLQIEDAHRGRPLIGRGDVWDRTGFAVSVLGTHSGNPARRSASARVERRSLFEETASINRPILKLGSSSSRRRALAAASVNRPSDAKAAV